MRLALIGAGRVAAHLGLALQALGRPPFALGAREPARAAALAAQLGLSAQSPEQAMQAADAVMLLVRDEAIAGLAASLPWQMGQLALHASGATPLEALAPGSRRAGFHPLQLFADPAPAPEAALAAWQGVRIGIEAGEADFQPLADLARSLGAVPLRLRGGQRASYHAAANLAASALFAPLHQACGLWGQALGLSPQQAWEALLPLAQGALAAAAQRGLANALSGPVARGDAKVLAAHLEALDAGDPQTAHLYRVLMQALLPLAAGSGRLDEASLARLRQLLAQG